MSTIRLRVIARDILVRCPYGQGYGADGLTTLKDCYVDSATPGTRCSVVTYGSRCEKVAEFHKLHNWRSYLRTVEKVTAHNPAPVRLVYSPLDTAGTKWMAVNVMTGERKQIDMRAPRPYVESRDGAYSAYLSGRRLNRLTTDGAQLCEPFEGWQGGGDDYSRREWCDCIACTALRPREDNTLDPADVYRQSLPENLRVYWDNFLLRQEAWRREMGLIKTAASDIDFVNGFGQGHARSPYTIGSSQEPPRERKTGGARVIQSVSAPVEPEADEAAGSESQMLSKKFGKLAKKDKPRKGRDYR